MKICLFLCAASSANHLPPSDLPPPPASFLLSHQFNFTNFFTTSNKYILLPASTNLSISLAKYPSQNILSLTSPALSLQHLTCSVSLAPSTLRRTKTTTQFRRAEPKTLSSGIVLRNPPAKVKHSRSQWFTGGSNVKVHPLVNKGDGFNGSEKVFFKCIACKSSLSRTVITVPDLLFSVFSTTTAARCCLSIKRLGPGPGQKVRRPLNYHAIFLIKKVPSSSYTNINL